MSAENFTEQLNDSNGKFINQEIYDSLVKIAKYSLRHSSKQNTLRTSDVVNEALTRGAFRKSVEKNKLLMSH